jgi:hypothetical protein
MIKPFFVNVLPQVLDENSRKPSVFEEKELPTLPRSYVEKGFNIRHWTNMPLGGHFAAMEQPELLSRDIIDFSKLV